jgi:hypothetical protein
VLSTTDDRFLTKVQRLEATPNVRVLNPVAWLLEGTNHGA